jgi:hypothetical protein
VHTLSASKGTFQSAVCGTTGRVRLELSLFVDFSAVTDNVDDDCSHILQDLEDDSIRSFSKLEQTFQFAFERVKFRGIEVLGEPLDSIGNAYGCRPINFLKLIRGGFQDADRIHWSDSKALTNFREIHATITFGNGFPLSNQFLAHSFLQHQPFVRVAKQLNKFLFDDI